MYLIFVNEKPLYLADSPEKIPQDCTKYKYEGNYIFDQVLSQLNETKIIKIGIYHQNLTFLWQQFFQQYKVIEAAGGVVWNENEELLVIKRFGKWDLPKGKVEKHENFEKTAIREVMEECNIQNLTITKSLQTTYHIYYTTEPILKIVYWYEMFYVDQDTILIPQVEEGIEAVEWMSKRKIKIQLFKNTYENIKYLLRDYYQ